MGLYQDEAFSDALRFALATGMPSCSMAYAIPVQMPLVLFAPPTCHDLMNPTTTTPFTTFDSSQTTQSSTKTSQPPWIAIPLNAIFPLYALQTQVSPQQWIPSPDTLSSAFWSAVKRMAELSACGALAVVLARLFSQIAEATPKNVRNALLSVVEQGYLIPSLQNLAYTREDQQPDLCDSLDLSSLLPIPAEDDLLRVDMTVLESMSPSELYIGEAELLTAMTTVPRLVRIVWLTAPAPDS